MKKKLAGLHIPTNFGEEVQQFLRDVNSVICTVF